MNILVGDFTENDLKNYKNILLEKERKRKNE